ncbi:MAG: ornithine cyclodeaminase family protein [Thermodesulfobacteriota bacterium]
MWIISRKDLENILTMEEVIAAVEAAFTDYARGKWIIPTRTHFTLPEGIMLYMPSFLSSGEEAEGILGAKLVSVFSGNPEKGLPLIYGLYLLYDPSTGRPLALIDGVYLTGIRTGAASAVATKYLSRKDSRALGIIGTGVQAGFHLKAIRAVRAIEVCYLFDKIEGRATRFSEEYSDKLGVNLEVLSSTEEVVGKSDVVVTVTTSLTPVFSGSSLREGTHLNVIGAFTPETREVDSETVKKACLFVDSYEGALTEAGDLLIPMKEGVISRQDIRAELSEVITGILPGRTTEDEITLFKSVGFAIEDAAVARLAYDRAREKGLGTHIEV